MSTPSETAVIPISSARSHPAQNPAAQPGAEASDATAAAGTDADGTAADATTPATNAPEFATQYAALRTGALLVDHTDRDLWTFHGAKAADTVTGLVTNDLAGLAPGHGCYAAALSAKGRILADVRVFACDPAAAPAADGSWLAGVALIVDVPPRAAEGWGALIRKFVNPRTTPYRREHERLRAFGVYGARARDAIADAFGAPPAALAALPDYAHATITFQGAPLLVARVPTLGLDGFLLIAPVEHRDEAWERVRTAVPGVLAGHHAHAAYDAARIEAGYPEWGLDVDETTIPQEANFDDLHAISYTKGCYTGQEVVARIHFRGHVNRHLRGLGYLPGGGPIPPGAELLDPDDKAVGSVRSAAISPRLGGVAIGMVRREVPLGATLRARWDGGERGVTVTTLPFPDATAENG